MTNPDFRELLSDFADAEVRYLVVGAYAVTFHARPRYTKDLGVWIGASPENAERAWRALATFGAPLSDVTPADLASPGMVLQIGVAPHASTSSPFARGRCMQAFHQSEPDSRPPRISS